jgi:hypothetical protein
MQQKACEIGPQTEPRLTGAVSAVSPSHRSYHESVLFSARTLLFLVDPEKSSLGATVPQRGMVTEIRRTHHNRRPYTRATGADSSGSFLRRIRQTLNATKSVRNWTPNRAEVDRCGLGREPEPSFGPRERTFLGSYPVVPCGPRKVEFGRYGTAKRDGYGNTPDQSQSSAIHTHHRR